MSINKSNIEVRQLGIYDLHLNALQKFNRYQETKRVMYKENHQYICKDEYFTEFWDSRKKKEVIQALNECVHTGGIVTGVFIYDNLIGFANVENEFYGKSRDYLELSYIHVSYEFRNIAGMVTSR